MFERRKRNLDLTGTKGQSMREASSHGISWETKQQRTAASRSPYKEDAQIESGWEEEEEEEEEEEDIVPADEIQKRHTPISQSRLAIPGRQNVKDTGFGQPAPSYPGLQKRPDFYEQHKKMTIYVERELMETMDRLKKERYIPSYSWLVAEAIKHYLNDKQERQS